MVSVGRKHHVREDLHQHSEMCPDDYCIGLIPLGSTRHANDMETSVWAARSDRGLCVLRIVSQGNDTVVVLSTGEADELGLERHINHNRSLLPQNFRLDPEQSVEDTRFQSSPRPRRTGKATPPSFARYGG